MADRIPERDPKIQQPQTRYDAAHGAIGSICADRWKLIEQWILVPERTEPWRKAHSQPDIEPQQDAQKQLSAFQPAWDALRTVPVPLGLGYGAFGCWTGCGAGNLG
ncbi:hypothetical protein [Occallatibacter riparius]|uniref:Uncharacterized protein n=1 Tax=Occallatibacter riparius TaxID=1002689 RepID=A0A9J7BUU1_9BACT|nr:hypothetical protein [Occallatibacter riparius]UWZ84686.1 hypothetical protein MOP44_01835 [Occallatibacter riparius]